MTITAAPRPEKTSPAMSGMAVMVAVCFALPGFYVIWRFLNSSSRSIDLIFFVVSLTFSISLLALSCS